MNTPQTSPLTPNPSAAPLTDPQPTVPPGPDQGAPATPKPGEPGPSINPQPPTINRLWDRQPDETQNAFSAFVAFLNLGPAATLKQLQGLLNHLPGQPPRTEKSLRNLSSRHHWRERAAAFRQHQANLQFQPLENLLTETSTLWSQRAQIVREQHWELTQNLNNLGHDALEHVADGKGAPPGLTQVARVCHTISHLGRQVLQPLPAGLSISPEELAARMEGEIALTRSYGPLAASGNVPNPREEIDRLRTEPRFNNPAVPSTPPDQSTAGTPEPRTHSGHS